MALTCYLRPPGHGDRTQKIPLPPAGAEAAGMAALAAARTVPEGAQWYSPAVRRPLEHDMGGVLPVSRGLILHVQVGDGSPYGWFARADVDASSHWWVSKTGLVMQFVPAGRVAWTQAAGNRYWHSVETEGYPEEPLTPAQVQALAALYRWGAEWWGWPYQMTDSSGGYGLGTHEMGGTAWGGHACPGRVRAGQRAQIVALAQGAQEEVDVPLTPEEIRAVGAESAAATLALLWAQMQVPPVPAPDGWHPPRQAGAAAVLRRTYEAVGELHRPGMVVVMERLARIESALAGEPAGPLTPDAVLAGLDEVRDAADLMRISSRAAALALARLTMPAVPAPPREA